MFFKSDIPKNIQKKMQKTVFDELSYLTLSYIGYDEKEHTGNMIVDKALADEVILIFEELYAEKFPINKMKLVCEYGGDDELSMRDNNTSAFNYRTVVGGTQISKHALGRAIDINPLVNPYIRPSDNLVLPQTAAEYIDRSKNITGMIHADSICVKTFKKYRWIWGGDWETLKDYQHFEK